MEEKDENTSNKIVTIAPAPAPASDVAVTGETAPASVELESTVKLPAVIIEHKDEILKALRDSEYLCDIANKYGIHRCAMGRYVHNTPELEEAYRDGVETLLDAYEKRANDLVFAEQEMMVNGQGESVPTRDARLMSVNLNAVKFMLERRAAHRGYGAKLETNEVGNGRGGAVPIIIMGEMSEEKIAEAEAHVAEINDLALEGLEGYGSMA